MDILHDKNVDVSLISPLTLAFIGDTVFDLLTRCELVCEANRPVNALHNMASKRVCAAAQAQAVKKIMPLLTEDETAIFKRGRNAHVGSKAKNASSSDYHYATGLESLFGWLWLKSDIDRIKFLYNKICSEGSDGE